MASEDPEITEFLVSLFVSKGRQRQMLLGRIITERYSKLKEEAMRNAIIKLLNLPKSREPEEREEFAEDEDAIVSPEQYIKHPLQNRWAMWFFKNDKNKEWTANLKLITAFDTVEDFWGLYNHIQKASKLPPGCDYSLFKDGIQPMWEDEHNKNGGRWLVNLNKNQRTTELDNFWLETLLCLIGEAFEELTDDICGATINIRPKGDKLGVWTRDARRGDATLKIGEKLKDRLKIPAKVVLGFQAHAETSTKAGSTARDKYRMLSPGMKQK